MKSYDSFSPGLWKPSCSHTESGILSTAGSNVEAGLYLSATMVRAVKEKGGGVRRGRFLWLV